MWRCAFLLLVFTSAAPAAARAQAQGEPADPLALVQQGKRLNTAGKQADAIQLYERALALNPDLFDAHLGMGIALDLQGRYGAARPHLARAIALAPADAKVASLNAMGVSFAFERKADRG